MNFYYPTQDHGPNFYGMAVGSLGIIHVCLAQLAMGGGMLLCYFEWLRRTGRSRNAARFINGSFQALVLAGFVSGAVTGVAIWFMSIQVSPRMIGVLVDEFHWIWATEWTFSCVEVVSGYGFLRYKDRLSARGRLMLLVFYSVAAWFSLFWSNGILSFQLTPGGWLATHGIWGGFFNPSFWPSLLYRTIAALAIAPLAAAVVINFTSTFDREARRELIGHASVFLIPLALMPFLGAWFLASIPAGSRSWVLGGSVAMTVFVAIGVGASLLIGACALAARWYLKLSINGLAAALLCAIALALTAGGEFVGEAIRKPRSTREVLYARSIRQDQLERLRQVSCVAGDPYPLHDGLEYPNAQLETGAKVFRFQCDVCHTYAGTNGVIERTATWTAKQQRMNFAQLQRTGGFMPPFAGAASDVEALVQLLRWRQAGMPPSWPVSNDPAVLAQIKAWLDEAGTRGLVERMDRRPFAAAALAASGPTAKERP